MPAEAKWAIENLNDTEIAGRTIFIREVRLTLDQDNSPRARTERTMTSQDTGERVELAKVVRPGVPSYTSET